MEIFPQILLSGASGLIGNALRRSLAAQGLQSTMLVRSAPQPGSSAIFWNPYATGTRDDLQLDVRRIEGMRAAIHLSGDNLSIGRWTEAKKKRIWVSRVITTQALVRILTHLESPPEVLICASAVGYYGNRGEEILTEDSPSGDGYLAELCVAWEQAADAARQRGIRVVPLRFGVVLARGGGALVKMLPLFKTGLGGRLGNGRQWMSWISLPDIVRIVDRVLSDASLKGPINAVAPHLVTNAEFTRTLAHILHRPALIAAPAFVLRAAFGEMADAALLASTRVLPARLENADFVFQHATLDAALHAAFSSGNAAS
ncbi:MAG TPA: TIGR01777 family oxidoreductase [Acidobacteriaceae bacterium]|nr:TIGR01777 family oxidoreductase [Acidobacteriaceae bacterium]